VPVPLGLVDAAELEPRSVLVPLEPVVPVDPVVPEAPIEVPPPVLLPVLLPVVPIEPVPVPPAVLLVVLSLGDVVVEGVVLDVVGEVDESVDEVASFLLQALSDRAAIRARAAHCAIGDLIIRNS
jgi:hypothetical protein